jgi:hypothetical protein
VAAVFFAVSLFQFQQLLIDLQKSIVLGRQHSRTALLSSSVLRSKR